MLPKCEIPNSRLITSLHVRVIISYQKLKFGYPIHPHVTFFLVKKQMFYSVQAVLSTQEIWGEKKNRVSTDGSITADKIQKWGEDGERCH